MPVLQEVKGHDSEQVHHKEEQNSLLSSEVVPVSTQRAEVAPNGDISETPASFSSSRDTSTVHTPVTSSTKKVSKEGEGQQTPGQLSSMLSVFKKTWQGSESKVSEYLGFNSFEE